MKRINVAFGSHSYPVEIAPGLIESTGNQLRERLLRPFSPVITDSNVATHHLDRLIASLAKVGIEAPVLILEPGEAAKSWSGLSQVTEWLVTAGIERGDYIIAFGGGVIGDLSGFAAAIVKRGCHFVQIPTTLLAQVDSSVGGKTAINISTGKNLVGAFHQPALVLIDPDVLNTLPNRELRAGYAEIVKYGLINDSDFFAWCEAHGQALLAGDAQARQNAIAHSIAAKAAIVTLDEQETRDVRVLLNLGHTFGHALEAETGYSNRLLHGESVAIGLTLAFAFSAHHGLCSARDATRVRNHFVACNLPTHLSSAQITADGARLAAHMAHDKKARRGKVPLILVRGIGQAFVTEAFGLEAVAAFLDQHQASQSA